MMLLLIFVLLREVMSINAADSCEASRGTVSRVNKCPENEAEWIKAAQMKDCKTFSGSCPEPERFVYHCVLNPFANSTVEVCAYGKKIFLGRCTEYSILGNLIQESGIECKEFSQPCPSSFYPSSEAYRYQECYNIVKTTTTTVQPTTVLSVMSTDHRKINKEKSQFIFTEKSDKTIALFICLGLVLPPVSILLVVVIMRRKHKKDPNLNECDLELECSTNSGSLVETCTGKDENHALLRTPRINAEGGRKGKDENHALLRTPRINAEGGRKVHDCNEDNTMKLEDVLQRLDDAMENLIETKSLKDLSLNVQSLFDTDTQFSDENIPLLQY